MSLRLEVHPPQLWKTRVAAVLADRLEAHRDMRICLPAGLTPRPLYSEMAGADLTQSTIFLLDEFGLPAGAQARCDEMLRRDLLDGLDARPAALHSLDPEAEDLEAECRRYRESVLDGGLALTLLGLGANGHLGLNEPGSTADSRTRVVDLDESTRSRLGEYGSGSETTWGMTLGLEEILSSGEVWLLVRGEGKAGILWRALNDPVGPHLPATFLRGHPNVVIWADAPAAGDLPEG